MELERAHRVGLAEWLAWGAAAVSAVASGAGLLLGGAYRDGDVLVRLIRADDSFRLLAVVPLLVVGLLAARRGSLTGRAAAIGALATLAYLYGFLAAGARVGPLSLLHVTALGLAFWAVTLELLRHPPEPGPEARLMRRSTAAFLVAMGVLSALNWGAVLASSALTGDPPADVVRLGLATNPLYTVELVFLVPLFTVAGLRVARSEPGAGLLGLSLVWLLFLLGVGLVWEAAGIAVQGAAFDTGQAVAGAVFAVVPALLLVPSFVPRRRTTPSSAVAAGGVR